MSYKNLIYYLIAFLITSFYYQKIEAGKYCIEKISSDLTENADAVIRKDVTTIESRSFNRSRKSRHLAVTVLNENGRRQGNLIDHYDSYESIDLIKAVLYDKNGNKIREITRQEFADVSYTSFSLYQDIRLFTTSVHSRQLPYTVEYEYVKNKDYIFFNEIWKPVRRTKTSLEYAKLNIIVPDKDFFRHISYNHDSLNPNVEQLRRGRYKYEWELTNINAIVEEPYMPPFYQFVPYVNIGANNFHYSEYYGNMSTWEDFGLWINELNRGRQNLSRSTINEIRELTENIEDTLEIIKTVYEYVQSSTRYVSIQLGIGGLQPFDARSVENNGHGDCKALSNYLQALLDAVGIKSYYTLIRNGSQSIRFNPEFPMNYFNHAIVSVPLENDTIWIEATSNTFPAGYIGRSNSGRYVLLITDDGGKLVRTPYYKQKNNVYEQNISAKVIDSQQVNISLDKNYSGYTTEREFTSYKSDSFTRKRSFSDAYNVNESNIKKVEYSKINNLPDSIRIIKNAEFVLNDRFTRAGERLIFEPVLFNTEIRVPSNSDERVHELFVRPSYIYTNNIKWELPENYELTHLPENVERDEDWGFYSLKYKHDSNENLLYVNRIFYMKSGRFDKEDFENFVDFTRAVRTNDSNRIMLIPE